MWTACAGPNRGRGLWSVPRPARLSRVARPLSPGARVTRYDLDGGRWTDLLLDHGFATASFELIDAPDESGARTLLVRARA